MALFNQAVGWLRRHRVLLPGVRVLARQVAEVRAGRGEAAVRHGGEAPRGGGRALPGDLVALLGVPDGRRFSELERLRRPPTRTTGTGLAKALERVDEIAAFRLGRVRLEQGAAEPAGDAGRGTGWARRRRSWSGPPEPKRTALLTAVVRHLEASAIDDALDLFAVLMAGEADQRGEAGDGPGPARGAAAAGEGVADARAGVPGVERAAGPDRRERRRPRCGRDVAGAGDEVAPREEVMAASALPWRRWSPADDGRPRPRCGRRWPPATTLCARSCRCWASRRALGAAPGGERVLAAVRRLPGAGAAEGEGRSRCCRARSTTSWCRRPGGRRCTPTRTCPQGAVDRDAYVVCVLEQLHRALSRRDVFASPSHRWADPRARLLDGKRWEACARGRAGRAEPGRAGRRPPGRPGRALDAAWQLMAERLEEAGPDAKLSFEVQPNGRVKLNVDRLDALGEPKSLTWLRATAAAMLPKIDLPDLLFEVHAWTGFLDAFTHLGDGRTRMEDLTTSLVALLVAEACNIG